jgi:thioredoxin reductase (NADPH)
VVHRRDKFRSEKILQDKLFEKEKAGKVTIKLEFTLDEVLGDKTGVTGMRIKHVKTGATEDIALMGVFIAIGHKPNTDSSPASSRWKAATSSPRAAARATPRRPAFPACSPPATCRTTSTARPCTSAGTGCMAALDAERYLDSLDRRFVRFAGADAHDLLDRR